MFKTCINCNKEFETNNNRKIYCSNSCKVINHRHRNGIDEPDFLLKKPKILTEKIERSRDIVKKEINSTYQDLLNQIENYQDEYDKLVKKKEVIFKELNQEQNGLHSVLAGSIAGIGGLNILATNNSRKKPTFENFLIGAATVLLGGYAISNSNAIENNKKRNIDFIKNKINQLDSEINYILFRKKGLEIELNQIPKYIELTVQETYFQKIPIIEEKPKLLKSNVISLSQMKEKNFDIYNFSEEYANLMGNPSKNFSMIIYGESGHGKSTWSIDFSNYLALNFGKLLYNSSEEGFSYSLQNKLSKYDNENIEISEFKRFKDLKATIRGNKYNFVVIDSLNDMELTEEQFTELINMGIGIIFILQATKGGNFKGSNKFAHDTDIRIKLENYNPIIEKSRFK
jgi:hypothetical protein